MRAIDTRGGKMLSFPVLRGCATDTKEERKTMKMRRGATYLEYALLAALIGIVGAVGVKFYGEQILEFFKSLGEKTAEVVPSK